MNFERIFPIDDSDVEKMAQELSRCDEAFANAFLRRLAHDEAVEIEERLEELRTLRQYILENNEGIVRTANMYCTCMLCGEHFPGVTNFCPHCGIRITMDDSIRRNKNGKAI